MIKEAIAKIIEREDLTEDEMIAVMNEIMSGEATDAQIGAFITGLNMKVESIDEITGAAKVMRQKVHRINAGRGTVVDTCGTGGDGSGTFNISTTAAFIAAGAGIRVAKHGNRSISSQSGSADVLQSLGVNIEIKPEKIEECIDKVGIGFLFAPALHGAMKYAIGPRREVGIRSIFNLLGPLTNPAGASCQVIGVYEEDLTEPIAKVLEKLGSKHALVVHGMDGLDEITLATTTQITEVSNGSMRTYQIFPEDFGLDKCREDALTGGTPDENAKITMAILNGEKGPKRDISLLNAGAAIVAGGGAQGLVEGYKIAAESVDSGAALKKLEKLKEMTNR